MGPDTLKGPALTAQNRFLVTAGSSAVKSGEHFKTVVPLGPVLDSSTANKTNRVAKPCRKRAFQPIHCRGMWWTGFFSLSPLGVPQTQAETGVSHRNGATRPTQPTVITRDPMAAKGCCAIPASTQPSPITSRMCRRSLRTSHVGQQFSRRDYKAVRAAY